MGTTIELSAADGHRFSAYRAAPAGKAKGAVVVIQEIFGVNAHIREVADMFAAHGYLAIAPALFDRAGRGIELGYDADSIAKGRDVRGKVSGDMALADMKAAVAAAKGAGPVFVVGYCWGGSLAWLAATRLEGVAASSGFYGGGVAAARAEIQRCPVQLHFGEKDTGIPLADVETFKQAHPEVPVFIYPAGHGFACDHRASYHKESAELATRRTLDFFEGALVKA